MLRIQCLFYKHEDKGQNSVFWGRVLIYLRWPCPCTYPRGLWGWGYWINFIAAKETMWLGQE